MLIIVDIQEYLCLCIHKINISIAYLAVYFIVTHYIGHHTVAIWNMARTAVDEKWTINKLNGGNWSVYMQYRYTVTMIYTCLHLYRYTYTYIHTYTHTCILTWFTDYHNAHYVYKGTIMQMYVYTYMDIKWLVDTLVCTYTYILYRKSIKFCGFHVNSSS